MVVSRGDAHRRPYLQLARGELAAVEDVAPANQARHPS